MSKVSDQEPVESGGVGSEAGAASSELENVLDRGLSRYAAGDLLAALVDWERAAWLAPQDPRAKEYLEALRTHFSLLEEHYEWARHRARAGEGVDLAGAPAAPLPRATTDAVDGWGLDEMTMPYRSGVVGAASQDDGVRDDDREEVLLWLKPEHEEFVSGELTAESSVIGMGLMRPAAARPEPIGQEVSLAELGLSDEQEEDEETVRPVGAPAATARAPDYEPLDNDMGTESAQLAFAEEQPTVERPTAEGWDLMTSRGALLDPGLAEDLSMDDDSAYAQIDFEADFADDPITAERVPFGDAPVSDSQLDILAEESAEGYGSVAGTARPKGQAYASFTDAALAETLPPGSAPLSADTIQFRVTHLLKQIAVLLDEGRKEEAIDSAEAALRLDPEGRAAPVILHRHRDLLVRAYEEYLGDLQGVPHLLVNLGEVSLEQLDHRAGFLLSRIDGQLSYDDILDVAGMPRLDAYRILTALARRGIVRSS